MPSARLSGRQNRYKIKLRSIGYRFVYEVRDTELVVVVIAVGRRDRNTVYTIAETRGDPTEVKEAAQHARAGKKPSAG